MVFTTLPQLQEKQLYGFVYTSIFKFENSKIIHINKSIKKMVIMKKMEKMILGKILRNDNFMIK